MPKDTKEAISNESGDKNSGIGRRQFLRSVTGAGILAALLGGEGLKASAGTSDPSSESAQGLPSPDTQIELTPDEVAFRDEFLDLPTEAPTDTEMRAMFGFDQREPEVKPVSTNTDNNREPAKWQLQANDEHVFEDVVLPRGWQATYTDPDGRVIVEIGDGQVIDMMGATFRYLPTYAVEPESQWIFRSARLLAHEVSFGLSPDRGDQYLTLNNLEDESLQPDPESIQEVAEIFNTEVSNWTDRDWVGGAFVYQGPEILVTIPRNLPGWVDVADQRFWPGQTFRSGEFSLHWHNIELDTQR